MRLTLIALILSVLPGKVNDFSEGPIKHVWKDLPASVYIYGVPTEAEISQWKKTFNAIRTDNLCVDADSMTEMYGSQDHYVACNDLFTVLHNKTAGDKMVLWRLLQYVNPSPEALPQSGFETIRYIAKMEEALLDYEPMTQIEMNQYAYLRNLLDSFYIRMLNLDIRKNAPVSVQNALLQEQLAARAYFQAAKNLFSDAPADMRGSMFSMLVSGSLSGVHSDYIETAEAFLHSLYDSAYSVSYPYRVITTQQIAAGYASNRRKSTLTKDQNAFQNWMNCRTAVSRSLSGSMRTSYDNTTKWIMRYKLISLKNSVEADFFSDEMLEKDCSDEELFSYRR